MTMNATFVFWTSYKTKVEDNDEHALSLFFTFLSCIAEDYGLSIDYVYWIAQDNDEPLDSSLSSATHEKNKKNIEN